MIYKDIENIYSHLVDEESKMIFNNRLRYSIDKNERQFCNCIQGYYKDWFPVDELLRDAVLKRRKIIIFGYGVYGKRLRDELKFWGGNSNAFAITIALIIQQMETKFCQLIVRYRNIKKRRYGVFHRVNMFVKCSMI